VRATPQGEFHFIQLIQLIIRGKKHTSGTASLSACALAASVVTVLFTNADLENAELRSGAARLVRNARENIVVAVKECLVKRERKSRGAVGLC